MQSDKFIFIYREILDVSSSLRPHATSVRVRNRHITLEESGVVMNGTWTPFLDRPHRACLEPSKFDLEERKSFTWAHNILFQNRHFGPVQNGLF